MAPVNPYRLWSLSQSLVGNRIDTINYSNLGATRKSRKPGAFRLVEVSPLLSAPPQICLWEFKHIVFGNRVSPSSQLAALNGKGYGYIAISHVWDHGAEVDVEMNKMLMSDKLKIDVASMGSKATKTISWVGLKQIAMAAKKLGHIPYIWLDFLCLDQVDKKDRNGNADMEKPLQICIMGDVYTHADAVVTMIGGVPSVQSVTTPTGWMDRAWTLQEAILNANTWVFIEWKATPSHLSIADPYSVTEVWKFHPVGWTGAGLKPGHDLCLVSIRHLLNLTDAQPLTNPAGLPTVAVLDGMTKNAGAGPRRALRACLSNNPEVRHTGVWRSMFMRTSSNPVDVVYSIMAIFNMNIKPGRAKIHIDPYRKNRDPDFVFNDLARKTAARKDIGPAWLTIGGVTGADFSHNKGSQIIPNFPHTEAANTKSPNTPPKMKFGKISEWVGFHVDDSPFYIAKYDIRFLTHSHPHIINTVMMKCRSYKFQTKASRPSTSSAKKNRLKIASIDLGSMGGKLTHSGNIPDPNSNRNVYGLYVGQVEDMRFNRKLKAVDRVAFARSPPTRWPGYGDQYYFVFISWDNRKEGWFFVGEGIFKPKGGGWNPPSRRFMITVGSGSQSRYRKWPASSSDPNKLDYRSRPFHHSYGFEPLPDLLYNPTSDQVIKWGYYKREFPTGQYPSWSKRKVHYDIRSLVNKGAAALALKLKTPSTLSALSARSPNPPKTTTENTTVEVTNDGHTMVPYSYDGWTRSACSQHSLAGVDGILIPKKNRAKGTIDYHARIWFGDWVMYVQIRFHKDTPKEFWNMMVVPYRRRGKGGYIANSEYIIEPPPTNPSNLAPRQPYPTYQQRRCQPVVQQICQPIAYYPIYRPIVYPIWQPVVYPIYLPAIQGCRPMCYPIARLC